MKYFPWVLSGCALLWALLAYVLAQTAFIHTQTYAVVLVIVLFVMVRMVVMQLKAGTALIAPREETIALAGVSLASVAALLCCLLAPETVHLAGAPGKSIAIADHGVTVQFPLTASALNDLNNLHVQLRVSAERTIDVGARMPSILGDMMLTLHPKAVATIETRGLGGNVLTMTQPTGDAFLSPILFFPKVTSIAGLKLPSDTFAVPARNRTVRAFLVTKSLMQDARVARMSKSQPGVLFSVDDANGKPVGHAIGFAADGLPQQLADLVLTPKIGLFPDVAVSSVPSPIPMLIGIVAYFFGGAVLWYRLREQAQ